MAMAGARRRNWLDRLGGWRRSSAVAPSPIVASRDLPPLHPMRSARLPRSPEALPDEALIFARGAAQRVAESMIQPDGEAASGAPLSIADGADLRALLDRVQQSSRRREALDQAAQARARIVQQLNAGKAGAKPVLQLVDDQELPAPRMGALPSVASDLDLDLDRAFQEALASALGTLRQISALSKP